MITRTLVIRFGVGVMLCAVGATGIALGSADEPKHETKPASATTPATPATPHEDAHHAAPAKSTTTRVTMPESSPPPEPKPHQNVPGKPPATKPATNKSGEAPAAQAPMHGSASESSSNTTADTAMQWLREGNVRWVKGRASHPNTEGERRMNLAEQGQHPFATILTCSDSRVPTERVFDRGAGDVFVVRVAGNVAGASEGGTIEYGVEHLRTPVLVVMGHTKCGAVAAAATNAELHGQLGALVSQIKPAIDRTRSTQPNLEGKELAAAAVRENVWQTVFSLLRGSAMLREKVKDGELRIVGAMYDVATGEVEFMGPHPWQAELLVALDARESRQMHVDVPEQVPHEQAGHR
ncbi:MAG: carbonic anhydrase [Phycisphaerales bacterium]